MAAAQPPYRPASSVPLWLPAYSCTPIEAFKRFWTKYAVFSGRASRSEYWWWILASIIVSSIIGTTGTTPNGQSSTSSGLEGLWFLVTLVPSLALAARRLHDANFSAWFLLLALLPVLGWIALLVFTILPPNPLGQRFDRNPGAPYPPAPAPPPYSEPPYPQPPYPGGGPKQ